MTTSYRTKPNPLLQYTSTFPPPPSLQHMQPTQPSQHQRHHSNPQMQAASMGMYVAQAQAQGQGAAAGIMHSPANVAFGGAAPHPHPPHQPPPPQQPQPMQMAPGQMTMHSQMQAPGATTGGMLLHTFPPLTDARRSVLHYAAVSRSQTARPRCCAS